MFSKQTIGAIAMSLVMLALAGCHDNAPAGAPAVQPAPIPTASMSMNDRLPTAVSAAFAKDRKDSTITKIKHRMNPDGVVHYTINSIDTKQVQHEDEYRADGVKVSKN